MMTMKSKGSLLVTLGILLTVGIASLIVSSESFAEEVGQTNIGVTFYGGKEPLKTEGVIKPTEQPVTDKDKKTSQQQDKVSRKTTAKTNPHRNLHLYSSFYINSIYKNSTLFFLFPFFIQIIETC